MTEEYSRPATVDDLKAVLRAFHKEKIDFLLIGGYALYTHGYHRTTVDIDIVVRPTLETGKKVKTALMSLPDKAAKDIDPNWFTEGATIRVGDEFIVDIMFNAAGQSFDDLSQYQETIDLDGIPVPTINLEGLLLTKRTVRDKDKVDRLVIERALREQKPE